MRGPDRQSFVGEGSSRARVEPGGIHISDTVITSRSAEPGIAGAAPPAGSRCLICGYELAGLDASGVCPECATPIERSLRGNLLRFASPSFVRSIRRGALLVFVAWLLAILGNLLGGASTLALRAAGVNSIAVIDVLFDIAMVSAMLFGWWMVSSPDPAFVGFDDSKSWRVRLRWMLPFASALILIETALPYVLGPAIGNTATIGQGPVVISFSAREVYKTAADFSHGLVLYAGLRYISALSLRFPSPRIRKESMDAAACLKIVLICGGFMVALSLAARFASILGIFAVIAAAAAGITALIWLILFLIVMGRFQSELARTLMAMQLASATP